MTTHLPSLLPKIILNLTPAATPNLHRSAIGEIKCGYDACVGEFKLLIFSRHAEQGIPVADSIIFIRQDLKPLVVLMLNQKNHAIFVFSPI